MEKKIKVKKWFEDHEGEIIRVGYFFIGYLIGGFVFSKITKMETNNGLGNLYTKGILKFFDPSTGKEVDLIEATEVVQREFSK